MLNEWKNRTIMKREIEYRAKLETNVGKDYKVRYGLSMTSLNLEKTNMNQACFKPDSFKQERTIDQDVDRFYEHLSRFKFKRFNRLQRFQLFKARILGIFKEPLLPILVYWREGFRRFKLLEDGDDIGQPFVAEFLSENEALGPAFDDEQPEYGEYLGNRITYYMSRPCPEHVYLVE